MTAEIKLPPMPEWAKMDNLNGMVPSEIRSALSEFACEAVRLNATVSDELADDTRVGILADSSYLNGLCTGYVLGRAGKEDEYQEIISVTRSQISEARAAVEQAHGIGVKND